jgi:RNA polymerase II subunit A-like phosphatase
LPRQAELGLTKVRQAAKYEHIKIVNQQWLLNSMSKWEKEDETPYLVSHTRIIGINFSLICSGTNSRPRQDPRRWLQLQRALFHSRLRRKLGRFASEEEGDSVPASQEEVAEDMEGVMPEAIEEGHSPVDDLKGFNWGEIDDELASFMGSDDDESDNESGAESVASDVSIRSRASNNITPQKRKVGDTTDDENSGDESTLAKKQRIANSRSTGLKTVKTPNSMQSESSLPTPGVTGDEEGEDDAVDQIPTGDDDDDDDDDPFGDDLEADLMAEFAAGGRGIQGWRWWIERSSYLERGERYSRFVFLSITFFFTSFSAEDQQIFLHTHGGRVGVLLLNGMEIHERRRIFC